MVQSYFLNKMLVLDICTRQDALDNEFVYDPTDLSYYCLCMRTLDNSTSYNHTCWHCTEPGTAFVPELLACGVMAETQCESGKTETQCQTDKTKTQYETGKTKQQCETGKTEIQCKTDNTETQCETGKTETQRQTGNTETRC